MANPTLDRLFRHMAWANSYVFQQLQELPEEKLILTAPNNEWSVGAIAEHIVRAAGNYVVRLGGQIPVNEYEIPSTSADISKLAQLCVGFDAQLRELAAEPDGITMYQREGKTIHRARSTILGQSIHHATEHRAQIAGILALHGADVIDLDAIDLWALGDSEGLGE